MYKYPALNFSVPIFQSTWRKVGREWEWSRTVHKQCVELTLASEGTGSLSELQPTDGLLNLRCCCDWSCRMLKRCKEDLILACETYKRPLIDTEWIIQTIRNTLNEHLAHATFMTIQTEVTAKNRRCNSQPGVWELALWSQEVVGKHTFVCTGSWLMSGIPISLLILCMNKKPTCYQLYSAIFMYVSSKLSCSNKIMFALQGLYQFISVHKAGPYQDFSEGSPLLSGCNLAFPIQSKMGMTIL